MVMVDASISPDPQPAAVDEAWRRIAELRLRLRESVHFYQHSYRGQPWLIIADQGSESYFRCSASAKPFLDLLDGFQTVAQALNQAQQLTPQILSHQDVVQLIANLKNVDLLQEDAGSAVGKQPQVEQKSRRTPNPWLRPFAIKFRLFDPDGFLEKCTPYVKPLFGLGSMLSWLVIVVVALVLSWLHWPELLDHGQARFSDPKNLLWYCLLYPVVKALHELGHACATKVWGGVVHEMGIMLLVFFPVPYVDSSAAHRFSSRNRRMLVSAAGIIVEVFLAAMALLLWVISEPGLLRDLAFDIMIIGGLSTLIFNANPLLRFDGYYILSELIEIPNLGTRSTQYLGYLIKRHLLDLAGAKTPVTAKGEVKWLFWYGLSAGIYRIFITLFIAIWVSGKFFIVGVVLAFWAVIVQLVYPALQRLQGLFIMALEAKRLRRLSLGISLLILLVAGGLTLPVGRSTYAEGIVSLPENALLRAGTDGIIIDILVPEGAPVVAGETIIKLENPELAARRDIVLARLEQARTEQRDVLIQDRTRSAILKAKVSAIEAEIEDVQTQLGSLSLASATPVVLSLLNASDLPGRYIKRGEVIGYVADLAQVSARVVITQADIDIVRNSTRDIKVRLRSRPDEVLTATFLRELPLATDRLPSRLLGSSAGGDISVDARDDVGVQTISNIFQIEITLPIKSSGNYLGQRIYVRFIHPHESAGHRLVNRLHRFALELPSL